MTTTPTLFDPTADLAISGDVEMFLRLSLNNAGPLTIVPGVHQMDAANLVSYLGCTTTGDLLNLAVDKCRKVTPLQSCECLCRILVSEAHLDEEVAPIITKAVALKLYHHDVYDLYDPNWDGGQYAALFEEAGERWPENESSCNRLYLIAALAVVTAIVIAGANGN